MNMTNTEDTNNQINDQQQIVCTSCNRNIDKYTMYTYYKINDEILCPECFNNTKISHKEKELLRATSRFRSNIRSVKRKLVKEKAKAKCRNKELDSNSKSGIGYIAEALVSKFLGIPTCFDVTDNFSYPKYDLLKHKDYRKINAKGSTLLVKNGYLCHEFGTHKNKKVDNFFCIGFDEDRKHVLAVFIIPNDKDISKLSSIRIYYNQNSKYNKFKENEEEVKKWDDLFHTMKLDNCPVLRNKDEVECGWLDNGKSEKYAIKQLIVNNSDSVSYDKNVGIGYVERLL